MAVLAKYDYPFPFNHEVDFNTEKQLFADIMDEAVFLHGAETVWISMTLNQPDHIFGEYLGKLITEGIPIRLVVDQFDTDFHNEDGALYTKFGILSNVGEATWHGTIQYFTDHGITPKPQDLILYKKTNKIFEVTYVTVKSDFKYRIDSILYNYDHVKLDTDNITDVDILTLDDLDDIDKADYGDQNTAAEVADDVINVSDSDGIFD